MPLLTTFGNSGSQSFGTRGIPLGGSAEFNSFNDYLQAPAGTAFQYGTGDFTIEMWIYPTTTSSPSGNGVTIFSQRGADYRTQRYLFLFLWPTLQLSIQIFNNDWFVVTSNTVTLNAWNHVALVRRSGRMRIFLNGLSFSDRANTLNYSDASAYPLAFGNLVFNNTYTFQGYMTNIRVAKSAYYTGNFTPSLTPFTRTSQGATNVQLLLNCRNTSTIATDSSANGITVTNNLVTFSNLTPYNVPYVVPPGFTPVSAVVTPSTTSVNEGSTVTFTVAGTNTTNGTYYYTMEQDGVAVTTADVSSASLSGSFTITGNSGSFNITLVKDLITEGTETFIVAVRQTSITGPILGATDEITINDTSITPAFTVTPASVDEGNSAAFTVQNLGPDGTYYWTVLNGTSANADFTATSGSFTVSGSTGGIDNGSGSFSVTTVADRTTEGAETFQVQVRSGSVSGPVLVTSASVTINDTSLPPAFTVTPASINEGATGTFTVTNLGPAGTYYYTFLHGTTTSADFGGLTGGTITTTSLNQTRNILVGPSTGQTTEGPETFQLEVRTGSLTGPVILTSASVTVNDTSLTPSVTVISTATAGSIVTPAGYSFVTVEAVGGGGGGFGSGISSQQAGGGGGAYARTANLIVTGGSTIVYYSVGSVATDSWVRVGTNAPPTTTFQGCLGAAGGNASNSTSGLGGTAAASIGNTEFSGGDGGRGGTGSPNGGGGAGDSGNGVTVPAGTNTVGTGGTGTNIVGGTGGVLATPSGNDPGGGGYGSGVGLQTNGGIGRVRIVFTTQSV